MYDTVHFWLTSEQVKDTNFTSRYEQHLKDLSHTYKEDSDYITGRLNNIKVIIGQKGVSLKGSVPKYYLGNNFDTFTLSDTRMAFEQITDTLGIPIRDAKVSRIDVAHNLEMNCKPEIYYKYLGECNRYKRFEQSQSVYFQNSLRTLLFYDKVAQTKSKREQIPNEWKYKNALRFELRFMSRLPKQFNQQIVTANDLINDLFYQNLIQKWYDEYRAISKVNDFDLDLENIKSPKDFKSMMYAEMIHQKGLLQTLAIVDDLRAFDSFKKPEYYSRLRRDIKAIASSPKHSKPSPLILELNDKIESFVKCQRA